MESYSVIDQPLLNDLAPRAEELLARHIEKRKVWLPHEFVPWSLAHDYEPDYQWQPTDFEMPDEVRSALYVNLLTEDNLPFYVRDIDEFAGKQGIWRDWTGIWTAEEARHSYSMRTFIEATRALDPVMLEKAREVQIRGQQVPPVSSTADGFVYVSLQELATRIAHSNTARRLQQVGEQAVLPEQKVAANAGRLCLQRIATDENFHFLFYRDLTSEAIKIDPSKIMLAAFRQVSSFAMPGLGIPNFQAHAKKIAAAGIYGVEQFYYDVAEPVIIKQWKLDTQGGLTAEAAEVQEKLMKKLEQYKKAADWLRSKATKNALAGVVS
jgi:acyl-[acyl-carrier-protein] desaturase